MTWSHEGGLTLPDLKLAPGSVDPRLVASGAPRKCVLGVRLGIAGHDKKGAVGKDERCLLALVGDASYLEVPLSSKAKAGDEWRWS